MTPITVSSQMMGIAISLLRISLMARWKPSPLASSPTLAMILGCFAQATYPVRLRSSLGRSWPPIRSGGISFLSHSLFLAPRSAPDSSSTTSHFPPSRSLTTAMLPVSAPMSSVALDSTLARNA